MLIGLLPPSLIAKWSFLPTLYRACFSSRPMPVNADELKQADNNFLLCSVSSVTVLNHLSQQRRILLTNVRNKPGQQHYLLTDTSMSETNKLQALQFLKASKHKDISLVDLLDHLMIHQTICGCTVSCIFVRFL